MYLKETAKDDDLIRAFRKDRHGKGRLKRLSYVPNVNLMYLCEMTGTVQHIRKYMVPNTSQKMKFSIRDFFSKCDQICSVLRIWSLILKKYLMENFIFCVQCKWQCSKLVLAGMLPQSHCGDEKDKRIGLSSWLHYFTIYVLCSLLCACWALCMSWTNFCFS